MNTAAGTPAHEEIERVAHAIWEAEGRPEGCEHEHWMRAKQLIAEGRGDTGPFRSDDGDKETRSEQAGFEEVEPGMVPDMKADPVPELPDPPMGRFEKRIADLPEDRSDPKASPTKRTK